MSGLVALCPDLLAAVGRARGFSRSGGGRSSIRLGRSMTNRSEDPTALLIGVGVIILILVIVILYARFRDRREALRQSRDAPAERYRLLRARQMIMKRGG